MPDLNAIQTGVRTVMTGDATLTAIVPAERIVDAYSLRTGTKTSPGTKVPCIGLLVKVEQRPFQQGTPASYDCICAVEAWSFAPDTLRSIAGRVMDLYAGGGITAVGFRAFPVTVDHDSGHLFDEATGLHRWLVSFSFDAIPAA